MASSFEHPVTLRRLLLSGVSVLVLLSLQACSTGRQLMPAPVLYSVLSTALPFENVHPELVGSEAEILYVTDRSPETDEDGELGYGTGRSNSTAIGTVTVAFGDSTWDELQADARSGERSEELNLSITGWQERVRMPPVPYPYRYENGNFVLPDELRREIDERFATVSELLRGRLALTPRKEVYVYVHGVNNTFADAAYATAELWHFMGREGVPILYSWPAGHGGLIRGYTYDRESSEFTITHFKNFLVGLAAFEEIEKVHIIAHSRGTDVVTTGLRELFAETRAAGGDPNARFRIHNLVLAAPDLDAEVMQQRMASARLAFGVRRMTIYTSKHDRALGAAIALFASSRRVGRLEAGDVSPQIEAVLEQMPNVAIVNYSGSRSGEYGHTYFRTNPAVASDLILALRYDRDPGAENGRPLTPIGTAFWTIDDDYLVETGGGDP